MERERERERERKGEREREREREREGERERRREREREGESCNLGPGSNNLREKREGEAGKKCVAGEERKATNEWNLNTHFNLVVYYGYCYRALVKREK